MKEKKLNRYEKIMTRADKRRPSFLREIETLIFKNCGDALVLDLKMLSPHGTLVRYSWSEKDQPKEKAK